MFMSAAATANPPKPSRAAGLLHLIARLIDCGKELAAALRQHGAAALRPVGCNFGTDDIALILARIARGLLLATALQERVQSSAARLDADPQPARPSASRKPSALRAATPPRATLTDPRLDALPTAEELARDIRRRPIGAVLADICRDLGILPSHPLWRDLQMAIIRFDGNGTRLLVDIIDRQFAPLIAAEAAASLPPAATPASTGPP
jgi:hypothetical protein